MGLMSRAAASVVSTKVDTLATTWRWTDSGSAYARSRRESERVLSLILALPDSARARNAKTRKLSARRVFVYRMGA